MKSLVLASVLCFTSLYFLPYPVNAIEVFEAKICVSRKGSAIKKDRFGTVTIVYIIFYDNGERRIVTKKQFDSTNIGDCDFTIPFKKQ